VIARPIAWVSTWSENGVANCAPFSFFNVISDDPPLVHHFAARRRSIAAREGSRQMVRIPMVERTLSIRSGHR